MNYTNKFVEFLNGANSITIASEQDYTKLSHLLKHVGLSNLGNNYVDLRHIAGINNCVLPDRNTILIEYRPVRGVTFGCNTIEKKH